MNTILLVAGGLAAAVALIHLFAGQKACARPLLDAPFDEVAKRTVFACWHIVSIDLVATAAVFTVAGLRPEPAWLAIATFVGTLHVLYAVLFFGLMVTARFPRPLAQLPQGFLLLPLGVLAWWGAASG